MNGRWNSFSPQTCWFCFEFCEDNTRTGPPKCQGEELKLLTSYTFLYIYSLCENKLECLRNVSRLVFLFLCDNQITKRMHKSGKSIKGRGMGRGHLVCRAREVIPTSILSLWTAVEKQRADGRGPRKGLGGPVHQLWQRLWEPKGPCWVRLDVHSAIITNATHLQ